MARYNANRYQYETSPRKLQPEYTPIKKKYPKKSTAKKQDVKVKAKKQEAKNINSKIIYKIYFICINRGYFTIVNCSNSLNIIW